MTEFIDLSEIGELAGKVNFEKESEKYLQTHPQTSVVNGKSAYFAKLTKSAPRISFLPLIFKEENDLAQFPIHDYVKIGEDQNCSFLCRGFIGKACPICEAGIKVTHKFMFRAIPSVEVGPMDYELVTDEDGSYRIEYVTLGKSALEQLEDVKANNGNYISAFISYSKKGERINTKYSLTALAPAIRKVDNKVQSIIEVDPLKKGMAKYPTLEDYVIEMTSDQMYSRFKGVIE